MTFDPKPDEQDIYQSSQFIGWSDVPANSLSKHFRTNTTGGASISPDDHWVRLRAGTTTGDEAQLKATHEYPIVNTAPVKAHTLVVFQLAAATPLTDTVYVGQGAQASGPRGPYLDLTNEQMVSDTGSNSTSKALTASIGSNAPVGVFLQSDFLNTETTIRVRYIDDTGTHQLDTFTASEVRDPVDDVASTQSNGADDPLDVGFVRQGFHFPDLVKI